MTRTTDLHDLPLTQETPEMQTSSDLFNAFLNAPVTKLDADEYMAVDLDSVSESLLGSGNLNFLMMQAGQTDEAISAKGNTFVNNGDFFTAASFLDDGAQHGTGAKGGAMDTAMDRPFGMPGLASEGSEGATGGGRGVAESIGASNMAGNSQSVMPFSDATSSVTGFSSTQTQPPPQNGQNGTSGVNGTNGTDGEGGGNTTVINNTVINNPADNIYTTINNIVDDTTNIVNNTTDNLFTTINNTTNNLTDIVNNIFGGDGIGPIGISLDLILDDLSNITLDFINGDSVLNVLNENLNLSPVLEPVSGLVGDILTDLSLDVILNPFQYDSSANDFDLHVGTDLDILGLDLPVPSIDLPLDAVEFLVGDIDLSLDLGQILSGLPVFGGGNNPDTNLALTGLESVPLAAPLLDIVNSLVDPVEDIAGDIDILGALHVDLLGLGHDAAGPDTDITLPLDIDLVDSDFLNNGLGISLDPVENLVGDIDLDLTVAGDILGDIADGLIDNFAGGTGTDNILSGIGDHLSDLGGHLLPFNGGGADDQDLSLDLAAGVLDTAIINDGLTAALDPVENLTGDIDIAAVAGLDLLAQGDSQSASDTDLHIEIDLVDSVLPDLDLPVNLDLVESITGDIDLDINVAADILSDPIGTLENIANNDADGLNGFLSDITGVVNDLLGVLGNDTAPLDLIDNLPINTGGLDLAALLPGDDAGGDIGSVTSWTETILPDAGNILGGGLPGGMMDILPDPVSILPALNLPTVPVIPVLPPAGGLFGGHHGGGLGALFG